MNRSIASFEELIDRYADYLSGKGIQFNPQGFPMLQPQMYLDEWPELMVPYRDRKARFVHNPSHTVLCLFTSDMRIYPRLEKALDDIPEYSRYMGAVGSDLTVTSDMDLEWQQAIMLINQLYLATLAVNGVKIVQNLRCGSPQHHHMPELRSFRSDVRHQHIGMREHRIRTGSALRREAFCDKARQTAAVWQARPHHGASSERRRSALQDLPRRSYAL